ncbi:MAG: glycoside hydrolase family 3 protein [Candidatus Latescibacterota bacterium]|nr:MAG: glycoside hydrolase family 3 protein [Candidatus Latescibacterota bacterium]
MNDDRGTELSPDIKFHLVRKIECHKVIGLTEYELLPHEAKYLEFHRLAGVILFERNIKSVPQVRELIEEVNEKLSDGDRTALIMVDHEGDFVSELSGLIGVPPSAMAIGATGDPTLAYDVAFETGSAMSKLGVNVVLAPVADCFLDQACSVTGLRTFGRDPERVAEFVDRTIRGYRDAGVLTCAKHFPGHGSTGEDSHETLPEVKKSLDELRTSDLVPFRRSVDAGVDMMMMSHIVFSFGDSSDRNEPASFDRRLMSQVLRDEFGFDGVVITDALEMEGARAHVRAKYGGLTGGFERSILAGSDLLLYSSPVPERMDVQAGDEPMIAVEVMQTIIDTLERIVDRSRIDRKLKEAAERHEGVKNLLGILDMSEKRVDALRERAAELAPLPQRGSDENVINLDNYAVTPAIYKSVADRSLVLLRDPGSFVPVTADRPCLLTPIEYIPGESLKRQNLGVFIDGIRRNFPRWASTAPIVDFERDDDDILQPVFLSPETTDKITGATIEHSRVRADGFEVSEGTSVVPVFSVRGTPPEVFFANLTEFCERHNVPFVLVTGWPLLDWIPSSAGCLVTLGASAQVAAAVSAVLAGETEARPREGLDTVL